MTREKITTELLAAAKALNVPGRGEATPSVFSELVANGSYEANMNRLIRLAETLGGIRVVTVQSPLPLTAAKKTELMDAFLKADGHTITVFRTRPSLLGGLRIFRNGCLTDTSVRGRINHLFQSI